jgi:hypothetical protein
MGVGTTNFGSGVRSGRTSRMYTGNYFYLEMVEPSGGTAGDDGCRGRLATVPFGGQLYAAIIDEYNDYNDSCEQEIFAPGEGEEDHGKARGRVQIWNAMTHEVIQTISCIDDIAENRGFHCDNVTVMHVAFCRRSCRLAAFARVDKSSETPDIVHVLVIYAPDSTVSPIQLPRWQYCSHCALHNFNSETSFDISFSSPRVLFHFSGNIIIYNLATQKTTSFIRELQMREAGATGTLMNVVHTFESASLSTGGTMLAVIDSQDHSMGFEPCAEGHHREANEAALNHYTKYCMRLYCLDDGGESVATDGASNHSMFSADSNDFSLDEDISAVDIGTTFFRRHLFSSADANVQYENRLSRSLSISIQLGSSHPQSFSWRPSSGSEDAETLLVLYPNKIQVWSAVCVFFDNDDAVGKSPLRLSVPGSALSTVSGSQCTYPVPAVGETIGASNVHAYNYHLVVSILIEVPMSSLILYQTATAAPSTPPTAQVQVCWTHHHVSSFTEPSLGNDYFDRHRSARGRSSAQSSPKQSPRQKKHVSSSSRTSDGKSGMQNRRGSFSQLTPVSIIAADNLGTLKVVRATTTPSLSPMPPSIQHALSAPQHGLYHKSLSSNPIYHPMQHGPDDVACEAKEPIELEKFQFISCINSPDPKSHNCS